ncbi:GGDEF domain-containing protein [Sedimenticola selenatireducens]|uniref:diguanylate cyclase n=1 Tax=Sedimenticola selenatireducens TaxID=191960 RepID=A0A557S807_9GAMM|nr:GGDEF domain-containing protein [Sedimenticola selenatireducens]TVO73558.1 GGDEF domain-containing protein [Sedimenticola selenatireducens]TVT63499.1 MAG: GGDEF domain-containing protein [Sedimenticola selenatireducens]
MTNQFQHISGNLKRVSPHPAHPDNNQETHYRFASKILALSGILQSTLEINELLALFAKEIRQFIKYDGLTYRFPSLKIDIKLGDQPVNNCAYELVVAGDHLGDLNFFRKYPFEDSELELIENLLAGLLYPLRNTLLYQRAVESATIDPLTGVRNRASMDASMKREIGLAQRHNSPLSVILMDIDHFKAINDQHGHLYGDQALKAAAQCAEQSIRESDMIFRYGGEEFLVLLTGTDLEGAQLLAERIRVNVQNLEPISDKDIQMTVSLGVTKLTAQDSTDTLFQRIDAALYRAKNEGRNRVIIDDLTE